MYKIICKNIVKKLKRNMHKLFNRHVKKLDSTELWSLYTASYNWNAANLSMKGWVKSLASTIYIIPLGNF